MAVYPDVKWSRVGGEGTMKETWGRVLSTARRAEATRVSTRRDVAKDSVERKGCQQTTQLYKQNSLDNFEPYETKRPQSS